MTTQDKLAKIDSIIMSCVRYDQLQTCLNLVNFVPEGDKFKVLLMIQTKAFKMRKADLETFN